VPHGVERGYVRHLRQEPDGLVGERTSGVCSPRAEVLGSGWGDKGRAHFTRRGGAEQARVDRPLGEWPFSNGATIKNRGSRGESSCAWFVARNHSSQKTYTNSLEKNYRESGGGSLPGGTGSVITMFGRSLMDGCG